MRFANRIPFAAFFALLAGCTAQADELRVLLAEDLPGASVDAAGNWESSTWRGSDWLPYPGGVTLTLGHSLSYSPRTILVYLAFVSSGEGAALAAGDLARIVEVNEERITLTNASEGDYYVRVVAR